MCSIVIELFSGLARQRLGYLKAKDLLQMRFLHTLLVFGLFGLVLTACQSSREAEQGFYAASPEKELSDDTNVIVLVGSEQAANTLLINASRRGYQLNDKMELEALDLFLMDFERPKGVSGAVAISDMQTMEPSATAGVDHFFELQTQLEQVAPADGRVYANDLVDWPQSGCAAQLSVGIIDGHVETTVPRLANADIVSMNFSRRMPAATEHGTAIADLLVGPGKLRNTRLYAASVVGAGNEVAGAGVQELILALNWMQASDVKVVNVSLAGPYNRLLEKAVGRAASRGMIIVAAVGNDGPEAEPRYPAAFSEVIAVTAVDRSLEVYNKAVRGPHIDFAAPGVDLFVTSAKEGRYLSGTSLAAPFVTALIVSDPFNKTADNIAGIREHVSNSARDIGPAGPDPIFGQGLPMRTWDCP